jgi:hypothetical protein
MPAQPQDERTIEGTPQDEVRLWTDALPVCGGTRLSPDTWFGRLIPTKVDLIGTLDNSPTDNPLTGGNLILDRATGSLYLSAGVVAGGDDHDRRHQCPGRDQCRLHPRLRG